MVFFVCNDTLNAQTKDSLIYPERRIHQNFKVNMFPMIGGRVSLNYELQLKTLNFQNSSAQFYFDVLGAIQLDWNDYYEPKGYTGGIMYKKYFNGNKSALNGMFWYLQGGLGYINHYENYTYFEPVSALWYTVRRNNNDPFGIGVLGIGRQYVLHNRFVLEFTAGIGLYFGKTNHEEYADWKIGPKRSPFVFGFGKFENTPIAYSGSIKLGYAFGSQAYNW